MLILIGPSRVKKRQMGLKPLLAAAMVALSLGLDACGGGGFDSTTTVAGAD